MDTFKKHQIAIAKKTLKLSDTGAFVLGGMTKQEARDVLKRTSKWTEKKIESFEK